jgi:hypothetical protein
MQLSVAHKKASKPVVEGRLPFRIIAPPFDVQRTSGYVFLLWMILPRSLYQYPRSWESMKLGLLVFRRCLNVSDPEQTLFKVCGGTKESDCPIDRDMGETAGGYDNPSWKLRRTGSAVPVNVKRYIMQLDMPEQK